MSVLGLRIGPFEIVDEAVVPDEGHWYTARRSAHSRRGATDVLVRLVDPTEPPETRAILQREFDTLKKLDDPRIPTPIAFYEGSGALILAGARSVSLDRIVALRRMNRIGMAPATLLDLGADLAEVLQHAHTRGVLHGHLWPGRLALSEDGRLWVWGMGRTPAPLPPLEWVAPERAREEPLSAATDQWSLGVSLAALITGHPAWRGATDMLAARQGNTDALMEPIASQWPALGRLLRRMLEPLPHDRFPSLAPVRQELLGLARKAGGSSARREIAVSLLRGTSPAAPAQELEPAAEKLPREPLHVVPLLVENVREHSPEELDEPSASTEATVVGAQGRDAESSGSTERTSLFDADTIRLDPLDLAEIVLSPVSVPVDSTAPTAVPFAEEESTSEPELENTDAAEVRPQLSPLELSGGGEAVLEEKPARILAVAPWLAVAMVVALAALSAWRMLFG